MATKKTAAKKTSAAKRQLKAEQPPVRDLPASRTIATDDTVGLLRDNPSRNLSVPGITPR
jgi:hypothetical protein